MQLPLCCGFMLLLSCAAGCASWDPPDAPPSLPTPRISPDSVVLEIEKVQFPRLDDTELDSLWLAVDEQYIPPEFRQHLADNGLRCGLLEAQLPAGLREIIRNKQSMPDHLEEGESLDSDAGSSYRQVPCRAGRAYKIAATEQDEDRVVPFREEGQVWAATFEQAQGLFSLVSTPLGDSRVKIVLTPQVEHGQIRQRFKPGPANYTIETGQEKEAFEFLRTETTLAPGATLIIGSSAESKGLGGWFFGDADSGRSVLLIRLLQTQYDDLFSEELSTDSFATPLD